MSEESVATVEIVLSTTASRRVLGLHREYKGKTISATLRAVPDTVYQFYEITVIKMNIMNIC